MCNWSSIILIVELLNSYDVLCTFDCYQSSNVKSSETGMVFTHCQMNSGRSSELRVRLSHPHPGGGGPRL